MLKTLYRKLSERFGFVNENDSRSRQMIAVIECMVNQNARDAGAATFPAVSWPILQLCNNFNVGILQMPCPEINFLGFDRKRQKGQSIREALETHEGRNSCRKISIDIVDRIEDYLAQGCKVLSILGGNPRSPGCAVHFENGSLLSTSGIFMIELQNELCNRHIEIPFRGIRDYDPKMFAQDIGWVHKIFSNNAASTSD